MKNDRGITILALVITIVVLLILSTIILNYGKDSIKRAKLETLKTNMMLIKAKTMECVEQANFKAGTNNVFKDESGNLKEEIASELKGTKIENTFSYVSISDGQYLYKIGVDDFKNMGLKDVELDQGEEYLVRYDIPKSEVEVFNTQGFEVDGNIIHDLTNIEEQ